MQHSDLTRFFANAQRVRVIKSHLWPLSRKLERHYAGPSAYDFLANILGSRPLLPNVRSVQCSTIGIDNSHKMLRSVHILFGPRLHELQLTGRTWEHLPSRSQARLLDNADSEDDTARMLSKVEHLAPGLKSIYIFLEPSGPVMVTAVSSMICGLNHLTDVHLGFDSNCIPLNPQAFVHLALLPDLRTLWVSSDRVFWKQGDFGPLPYTLRGRTFPALRTFTVWTPTLHLPVQLLQFVTSPHLTEIYITTTGKVLRRDIRPFFAAIAAHPSRKTLHGLRVEVDRVVHCGKDLHLLEVFGTGGREQLTKVFLTFLCAVENKCAKHLK